MDDSVKVSSEELNQTAAEVENKSEKEKLSIETSPNELPESESDKKEKVADNLLDCGDISTNTSKDFGDNQKLDSFTSDHDVKLKLKPLESEPDQRNTSTSNAGESEYESANEEDLLEFETTDKSNEPLNLTDADSVPIDEKDKTNDIDNKNDTIASENTPDTEENKNFVSLDYEDTSIQVKLDEDEYKLSDNEKSDIFFDEEEFAASLNEESCNEGDILDDKLDIDDKNFDSERENGDGEESETQDAKAVKAAQIKSAKNAEAEDKRNPQYIPRKGPFYEHDDRLNEEEDENEDSADENKTTNKDDDQADSEKQKPKKKLLSSMKLCSDEIFDEQEADKVSKKSISSEQLDNNCSAVNKQADEFESSPVLLKAEGRKKPLWDSGDRWSHDKFVVDDQKPKTRDELISIYGYDIRNEMEAPKLQRRSKYGKGPQKYSRRSEDESAYAKKTLRKAIRGSTSVISENNEPKLDKANDFAESHKSDQVKVDQVYENSSRVFSALKDNNRNNQNQPERIKKETSHSNFSNHRMPENSRDRAPILSARTKQVNNLNSGKENFAKPKEPVNEINKKADKVFNDQQHNEAKSNELFTNDDFPELVSTASSNLTLKPTTTDILQQSTNDSKGRVIYYQVGGKNEHSMNVKDIHLQSNCNTNSVADSLTNKESIADNDFDMAKPVNQYVPVVKSQLFENSRYSRNRMNQANQDIKTSNHNWNSRINNNNKPNQTQFNSSQQQHVKKQTVNMCHSEHHDQKPSMNDINDNIICNNNNDSRPKRYSSIRQQRITTGAPVLNNMNSSTLSVTQSANSSSSSSITLTSSKSTSIQSQQYVNNNINSEPVPSNLISSATKNSYYDLSGAASTAANSNEITHSQSSNLMPTATNHPSHPHNYVTINGASSGTSSYIPTAPPPLMAYYDPTTATGQTANATPTAMQTQLGLTSAYFGTDQSVASQAPQNYYLATTDLTAVAYHPAAYHLPANYQAPLAPPQSHVANRYLNTTPANAPSAESNRYLQTGPTNQTSTPLIVAGGVVSGQTYQQSAFPSGYPQFPPPAPTGTAPVIGTSPLPAGYPNVPLSNSSSGSSTQQQTASGYPELYRGGITYYDIQSQQQAMQRQMQQSHRRNKGLDPKHENIDGDCGGDSSQSELAKQQLRPKTKFLPATN